LKNSRIIRLLLLLFTEANQTSRGLQLHQMTDRAQREI